MGLSSVLKKRREYPELHPKTKEKLSDIFFFKYLDSEDNRIKTKPLKYMQRISRPYSQDIFNIESEVGHKPNQVLKGLYYKWNEAKKEWDETNPALQDPYLVEDVTELYYKEDRPNAYPKGYEDPYGPDRPAMLDDREQYIQQLETLVSLAKNNMDMQQVGLGKRYHNTSEKEVAPPPAGTSQTSFSATQS